MLPTNILLIKLIKISITLNKEKETLWNFKVKFKKYNLILDIYGLNNIHKHAIKFFFQQFNNNMLCLILNK